MTPSRAFPATSDDEDDDDEYDDEDSFGAFGDFPTPGLPDFTPTRTEVTPGRYGDRGFRALGPLETPSPRSLAIRREEENAMATRIQAVGRGYLARVEYRARMDAARRTESAARRTEEVARRTYRSRLFSSRTLPIIARSRLVVPSPWEILAHAPSSPGSSSSVSGSGSLGGCSSGAGGGSGVSGSGSAGGSSSGSAGKGGASSGGEDGG